MDTRQQIMARARTAAREADMVSVLGRYGIGTRRVGAQIGTTCPWCGAGPEKAIIHKLDGTQKIKCFSASCGRPPADTIDVARQFGGLDYNHALAELADAVGGITPAEADIIIGNNSASDTPRRRPMVVQKIERAEPEPPKVEPADPDVLDVFYRTMAKVTRCKVHEGHLTKDRGLKSRGPSARLSEYCDWPGAPVEDVLAQIRKVAKDNPDLVRRVSEQVQAGRVPGVVSDGKANLIGTTGWTYSMQCEGVAQLFVDDLGLARAVQIRMDNPPIRKDKDGQPVIDPKTGKPKEECKYRWLSSAGRGGASPGAPAGWIDASRAEEAAERREKLGYGKRRYRATYCIITEGKFKAEVLAAWGYNAIYVAGVGLWQSGGVIGMIRRRAPEGAMIGIAYDMDGDDDGASAKQSAALADALLAAGYRPVIWTWPPAAGKGIDDLIRNGQTKGAPYEGARKVQLEPYRESDWCRPVEKVEDERRQPKGEEIPLDQRVTVVLGNCRWRDGRYGRSIVELLRPGASWGTSAIFRRLPVLCKGAVVNAMLTPVTVKDRRGEDKIEIYAKWGPASKAQIFGIFGAPTEEPTGRKSPERKAWDAATKAEEATAKLRLACEVDLLFKDVDDKGAVKGLPCDKVDLALRKWGSEAAKQLRLNPYACGRMLGVSLQACDRIAGVHKGDPEWLSEKRLMWCSTWAMDYETDCGHTRVPVADVTRRLRSYCNCKDDGPGRDPDPPLILDPMYGHYQAVDPDGTPVIVHGYYERIEKEIAAALIKRRDKGKALAAQAARGPAPEGLSADQWDAVRAALTTPGVSILTGGPGTGKTSTVAEALRLYIGTDPGAIIRLCAPTGRAAQRLREATGQDAQTIHALLDIKPYAPGVEAADVKADLVLVDEASMADIDLMGRVLRCVPIEAQIWICGDKDQLEAVGPGAFLRDVLAAGDGIVGMSRLTTVHRQAEGSAIIDASRAVNDGRVPASSAECKLDKVQDPKEVVKKIVDMAVADYDPARPYDTAVVCVTNKRCSKKGAPRPGGTAELNEEIQKRVNPPVVGEPELQYGTVTFRIRDKVVITRNRTVNGHPVYSNGDLGIVGMIIGRSMHVITQNGAEVILRGDALQDVRLAYATTVHKAQGSGYKHVYICLTSAQVHSMPGLTRSLLYTAISRAEQQCTIVYDGDALEYTATAPASTRRTGLQTFLRELRRKEVREKAATVPTHARRTGLQAEFYKTSAKREQDAADLEAFFADIRELDAYGEFAAWTDAVEAEEWDELEKLGWV